MCDRCMACGEVLRGEEASRLMCGECEDLRLDRLADAEDLADFDPVDVCDCGRVCDVRARGCVVCIRDGML